MLYHSQSWCALFCFYCCLGNDGYLKLMSLPLLDATSHAHRASNKQLSQCNKLNTRTLSLCMVGFQSAISPCIVLMCVAWNLVFCLGNAGRVTVIMPTYHIAVCSWYKVCVKNASHLLTATTKTNSLSWDRLSLSGALSVLCASGPASSLCWLIETVIERHIVQRVFGTLL